MRRLLVTLLLASAPLLSQTRDDRWWQDLQYLAAALPKTHLTSLFNGKLVS